MKLHVLGSSSKGNGYILESEKEALIIECGMRLIDVKKALNFNLSKVVGAIVTHEHGDHAKWVSEYLAAGIRVMGLPTIVQKKALQTATHGFIELQTNHGYKMGEYKLISLPVTHDVPCVAYVINHKEMGTLLFCTDTVAFNYVIPGVNQMMIEANYEDNIVLENIDKGSMPIAMRYRLLNSHMEIEQTKRVVSNHVTPELQNIVLIHLSDGNSNEQRFKDEITNIAPGCGVYVADKGLSIDLNQKPY